MVLRPGDAIAAARATAAMGSSHQECFGAIPHGGRARKSTKHCKLSPEGSIISMNGRERKPESDPEWEARKQERKRRRTEAVDKAEVDAK